MDSLPFYDNWKLSGPDERLDEDPPKGTCPRCRRPDTYLYRAAPGVECCIWCVDAKTVAP